MTETVKVIQADREAAADLIEQYWSGADESMMKLARSYRAGHSQGVFARAFAVHRLSATEGMREALEEAREALSEYACHSGPVAQCIRSPEQCQDQCGRDAGDALLKVLATLNEGAGE